MKYISVVNFEEHQHYKDRNFVSWIKLYTKILNSHKLFTLTPVERWIYITLLLLAPQKSNRLPQDIAYIKQKAGVYHTKIVKDAIKKMTLIKLIEVKEYRGSIDTLYTDAIPRRVEKKEEKRVDTTTLLNKFKMTND